MARNKRDPFLDAILTFYKILGIGVIIGFIILFCIYVASLTTEQAWRLSLIFTLLSISLGLLSNSLRGRD